MNRIYRFLVLPLAVLAAAEASGQQAPQLGEASLDKVVKAMTLEEKAMLVVGTGMESMASGSFAVVGQVAKYVPGAAGSTFSIERLGVPPMVLADGPAGLRINPTREGTDDTFYCTHFPIGTLLSSTWNTELVESVGKAIGEEVHDYGVDVLLGPALNIQRHPLCGRNFEYYSEDPLLTGKIAASYVKGVQSNGVGTSIKHFAVNNQETNRQNNDARVSERALREIYLKGFEITVKEADPWTIMSSYNLINGVPASENKDLLTTVLRDEWGYKGMVMTDWFGGTDPVQQVWAGNDLLEPGTMDQYNKVLEGVKNGSISMADLDRNVKNILNLALRTPRFRNEPFSNKPDLETHAEMTRQSALEGMVLLKNDNGTLPLRNVRNVALFGYTSYNFIAGGTGSGNVNRAYTVSLLDGLRNVGFNVDDRLEADYEKCRPAATDGIFDAEVRPAELLPAADVLADMAADNDVAVITLGRISGEFRDRSSDDFMITPSEKAMLDAVTAAFHKVGKKVVVILNIGGVIETASWKDVPDAILCAWQAGQEGGNSVADILSGKESPSGKLPMTFPVYLSDAASSDNFPIDQESAIFVDGTTGAHQDKNVRNIDYTEYQEGVYVGYRWFEKQGLNVSYPFGYGLSYTEFSYSDPVARPRAEGGFTASVTVTNTGDAAGKEVVEVYVAAPKGGLDKPVKELKAFAKTRELQPGESQTLEFEVSAYELASFDEAQDRWETAAGEYIVHFGSSSADIRAKAAFSNARPSAYAVTPGLFERK